MYPVKKDFINNSVYQSKHWPGDFDERKEDRYGR